MASATGQGSDLRLSVFSPERKLLDGETIVEVTIPGSEGQIQILEGHAPMIGTLDTGILSYKTPDGRRHSGVISSGFFEIRPEIGSGGAGKDSIVLMCEHIQMRGEISTESAKRAQAEAEKMLKEANLDEHAFNKYQLQLERAMIEQQLTSREHETER